ncbi:MAG: hypothetical protein ACMUIA_06860, partial [bacterium]
MMEKRVIALLISCCCLTLFPDHPIKVYAQTLQEQQALREQLNLEVRSLFHPPLRQRWWRFDEPPARVLQKCGTPLLRKARRHKDLLTPENSFVLYRPTSPELDDPAYYDEGTNIWHYESQGGHFRIYYTEDAYSADKVKDADGIESTIPSYVTQFAQYFEDSWSYLIDTLGYEEPVSYGERVEVFIMDINAYGITSADSKGLYVIVNNDYQWTRDNLDIDGKEAGAMKITAVHEFFHVVQAIYDHWPTDYNDTNLWWEENTAVWVEDELYSEVKDYLHYLGWPYEDVNDNGIWDAALKELYYDIWGVGNSDSYRCQGWFDYPDVSLNEAYGRYKIVYCPFGYFEYGGVIWAKFLAEHFGRDVIRTIYEQVPVSSYNALQAIKNSITGVSGGTTTFDEEFIRFKLTNLFADYEEGDRYPLPYHEGCYSSPSNVTDSLYHLSCKYYAFRKPADGQAIRLVFDGYDQTPFAVLVIPATSYALYPPQFGIPQRIPLNELQQGSIDFSFSRNPSYPKLVIVPINLSWVPIYYPSPSGEGGFSLDANAVDENGWPPIPVAACSPLVRDGGPVVAVGWSKAGGVDQYQIWRGREGDYQALILQSPYIDANVYEDTDAALAFATPYRYQVKFINAAGSSSSDMISVVTPEAAPS